MNWNIDVHKYPSEDTRTALKILAERNLSANSSDFEINEAEKALKVAGVYKQDGTPRIRRALFTYFKSYHCLNEEEQVTDFGHSFYENTISVREFCFCFITNYEYSVENNSYFPCHLLLKFIYELKSIGSYEIAIFPHDFSLLVECKSIEEITSSFVKSVASKRPGPQDIDKRAIGFDTWAYNLVNAGIFAKENGSLRVKNENLFEWLLNKYSNGTAVQNGTLVTGLVNEIPLWEASNSLALLRTLETEQNAFRAFLFDGVSIGIIEKFIRKNPLLDIKKIFEELTLLEKKGFYNFLIGFENLVAHKMLKSEHEFLRLLGKIILNFNSSELRFDLLEEPSVRYGSKEGEKFKVGRNLIYFGPPGTGKSHRANVNIEKSGADSTKTLFHPDYTYGDFFGTYRPAVGSDPSSANFKDLEGQEGLPMPVNYFEFVPGPFMKAILYSLQDQTKPHYLLIDEINRGDCSAIFGDVFQLLDRRKDGSSEYGVELRPEAAEWLGKKVTDWDLAEDGKLRIPSNLSILGTMNTSDQNLYPMDTAFKRRWEWKSCNVEEEYEVLLKVYTGTTLVLGFKDKKYKWIDLLKKLNRLITSGQQGMEDKQIGPWFIKPAIDGTICHESFANKLLFYLWCDVFKDDHDAENCPFVNKCENGSEINTFGMLQSVFKDKGLEGIFKPEIFDGCLVQSIDVGASREGEQTSIENLIERP